MSKETKTSLPDMQNSGASGILGANVPILQVGISNFKLPLKFASVKDDVLSLEASVNGTVSLAADKKGINMSRIMRVFYDFKGHTFTPETLEAILLEYKSKLDSKVARLKVDFNYPILKKSLRSGMEGWQYYQCAYEGYIDEKDNFRKIIHFDFVYSSACPCSAELSEHAEEHRGIYAVPHSQRSKCRVSVQIANDQSLAIEDLQDLCLKALVTETQAMVKREDEQAFAELNGEQLKFVEDAARLVYAQLASESRIVDFQVAFAHLESLHSHDAVALIHKGVEGGFAGHIDDFKNLIC